MPSASGTDRVTYLVTLPADADDCPIRGCPRQRTLEMVIRDAIATLERTRTAFKSRQLGELRERLERALES
jgi:hypothetical protein